MSNNSFLNSEKLLKIGFKSVGENAQISSKASFYDPESISIGSNVRIDDFAILSGEITLGSYIHISAYVALYGLYGIEIGDFSGLSPRVIVFSASDDFSGEFMIGPLLPKEYTNVINGKVHLKKFVQIGSGSIVLPNVLIGEGAVTGAMTLVNKNLDPWTINVGIPAKFLKKRNKGLLKFGM